MKRSAKSRAAERAAEDNCRLGRRQPLTKEGNEAAKLDYGRAIELAPKYLPAYAELSYLFIREYQNAWGEELRKSLDDAKDWADQAVDLGNDVNSGWYNDFRGRYYRAIVYWNEGEFIRSFDEFEAARQLITDPARAVRDTADLDADMAEAFVFYGQPHRAIALIQAAMVRNPNFIFWYEWNLGRAYYMARRYNDAIDAIGRIADPPNDVLLITAASKAQLGDLDAAQADIAKFSKNDPEWSIEKAAEYKFGRESRS